MLVGKPVTVKDMALARERRVRRREELLQKDKTVVSFSLNIPGEVKDAPVLRRVFLEGERLLKEILQPEKAERYEAFTGWEGLYLCAAPAERVKEETVLLEESHPLGRLFDLDVFSCDGSKLSRPRYRRCFLCGRQAQVCARSRAHPLEDLVAAAEKLAAEYFRMEDARRIGALAEQALLYEVSVTPKPGLVDRWNNGSHRDMELWTFLQGACALRETFILCAQAGMEEKDPLLLFRRLRQLGICGEAEMLRATRGINTHKGAVFSLGLLCGAVGQGLVYGKEPVAAVKEMSPAFLQDDQVASGGFGSVLYREGSCGGIRREAALGYPHVTDVGLPAFREALDQGISENDAGVWVLLRLIGAVEDTNLIRRSGFTRAAEIRMQVAEKCENLSSAKQILAFAEALDQIFIEENISPGGCADLLAVTWFLAHLPG